jgi:hypothetical protein
MKLKTLGIIGDALASADQRRRYEARYAIVTQLARRWGFRMYNMNLEWPRDGEHERAWTQFPEASADREIKDRRFVLYSMAQSLAALPGDTVECGVFTGASSFLMCLATAGVVPGRLHHVFDSFSGLSEPEAVDAPRDGHTFRWQKHDLLVPLEKVKKNLSRFEHIRYYQGWIPTRFQEVADRRFCLVHVDVDLYQPTLDSIAFFYERLVPGGMIVCDDYGSSACPGAKQAFDEFMADKPEKRVIHLPTSQGFIVKR